MGEFYLPEFLRCPICSASIEREGGSLYCTGERRHTYDISREGYVNLLPPGRAKNAKTGDSADMIRARERFLSGGAYDRYSAEAARIALEYLGESDGDYVLIDSGCGEGRHTLNMATTVASASGKGVIAAGFDASKFGVQAAAKRYVKGGTESGVHPFFAAGNIFSLPVADQSADIFTSLFAPLPADEVRRVLKPGGILMICAAGGEHLSELRNILYEDPIPSGGGAPIPRGISPICERVIEYKVELPSREDIDALFTMTPFYHNAPPSGRAKLETFDSLTVTVQVICRLGSGEAPGGSPEARTGIARHNFT